MAVITKEEVLSAQKAWGKALIKMGNLKNNMELCDKVAEAQIKQLYAVDFIGGNKNYPEDIGFALQPWIKVRFENAGMILEENRAIAMGNYILADLNGVEMKVEYTFGYLKTGHVLKIDMHHSSLPYSSKS